MTKKLTHIEYGCTPSELESIPVSARKKYLLQKGGAKNRGIGWRISLAAWWRIWQESGKWSERGHGPEKYAMGRIGDSGPYHPSNVYICTNSQNSKDLHKHRPGQQVVRGGRTKSMYLYV